MKQIIRKSVEKIFEKTGHTILNKAIMPVGIDMQRDILSNTGESSINTVFDVGAHEGQMSLHYRDIFKSSTVYSFEPISTTYSALVSNTSQDNHIKPFNLGLSETSGEVDVYLQSDSGLNSLNAEINTPDATMNEKIEKVSVTTVDEFCAKNGINSVDLLKTDTEGFDLKVLKGAESLIDNGKVNYILVEVGFNEDNVRNTPFEDIRKYLLGKGYRLRGFFDQSDFWNKKAMDTANALFFLQ